MQTVIGLFKSISLEQQDEESKETIAALVILTFDSMCNFLCLRCLKLLLIFNYICTNKCALVNFYTRMYILCTSFLLTIFKQ